MNNGIWGAFALTRESSFWQELTQNYGTPLYLYHAEGIRARIRDYLDAAPNGHLFLHYAVKANNNLSLLRLMQREGVGFDVVSGGELYRVEKIGADLRKVVFSGVGKTDDELRQGLALGIGCFNVESLEELERLNALSVERGLQAPVAIRVNPNIDAQTHPYISTGLKENKFGIVIERAAELYRRAFPGLRFQGLSCHIGSQITTLSPFLAAQKCVLELAETLRAEGIVLEHLDLGGGLGVAVSDEAVPTPRELINALGVEDFPYALHLEPGRSLVANNALLLTSVIACKEQSGKRFITLDAGMNDYIRPALYQAKPRFFNLSRTTDEGPVDFVGPVCETGDTFARDYPLNAQTGDLIAISGVGAYGMSMSSDYNSRPKAAEVLLEASGSRLIRRRQNFEDLCAQELPFLE